MRQLIINADDFGLSEGVNRGIIECYERGVVTNSTVMANAPGFKHAVGLVRKEPGLKVGVHLNVIRGRPVLPPGEVAGIVEADGEFISLVRLFGKVLAGALDIEAVYRELRAQVELVLDSGISPTHFDSHRHFHNHPLIMEVVKRLCQEFGVKRVRVTNYYWKRSGGLNLKPRILDHYARQSLRKVLAGSGIRTTGHYSDPFGGFTEDGFRAGFERFVKGLPGGTTEVGCHPGYNSGIELKGESVYDREKDLKFLLDPETRATIQRHGVRLVSFEEI